MTPAPARKKKTPRKRSTDIGTLSLAALRRRPAQQRGVQRVKDVLDAFEKLLREKRFEDITMDDLSRTADIQIGSLYHFFPDMTAVILTVLERALAEEGEAFGMAPEDALPDLVSYLDAIELRLRSVWHEHGRLLDVFFAYQRHPLIWRITLEQRDKTARLIGERLLGLMPDLPAERALELGRMIGMVMAVLLDNLIYLPIGEQQRLRRETYAMLERYVGGEPGSATTIAPPRSTSTRRRRSTHA